MKKEKIKYFTMITIPLPVLTMLIATFILNQSNPKKYLNSNYITERLALHNTIGYQVKSSVNALPSK